MTVSDSCVGCGHCARVCSLSTSCKVISVLASLRLRLPVTVHGTVRAKPCAGKDASLACAPNHGQHTGAPPRMDLPGANLAASDTHTTGACCDLGRKLTTCAPCRQIVARPPWLSMSA